jgi:hypothetical protein
VLNLSKVLECNRQTILFLHRYAKMEPFNIRIIVQGGRVALTILPEGNLFKIVYYAGILGGIKYLKESNKWVIVPENELTTSDLPPYQHHSEDGRLEVKLDEATIAQIGKEIENYQ